MARCDTLRRMIRFILATGLCGSLFGQQPADLYKRHCAACHDASQATRAPSRAALQSLSPEAILRALEPGGPMQEQGKALGADERRLLARNLSGGKEFGAEMPSAPKTAFCKTAAGDLTLSGPSWDGWGVNVENTRFQSAAAAKLTASDVPKLRLKWAFAFPNAFVAYAQPTVMGGRVFVGSAVRTVYSLDAETSCIYWALETSSAVRNAIVIEKPAPDARPLAYFGDRRAYVYAVDAATGHLVWKTNVEDFPNAGITGAVKVSGGKVFIPISILEDGPAANPKYECCKSRSSVVALDAVSGKQIWKTYTIPDEPKRTGVNKKGVPTWGPSGASVWGSPTLDLQRKAVYVGTGDNHSLPATRTSDAILAFDMDTGKMLWSRQVTANDTFNVSCVFEDHSNCPDPAGPDFDFGSSPILTTLANGKRALIAGQKSGMVTALDPDNQGEVLWQTRVGKGGVLGGVQWGSATDGKKVYVPVSDVQVEEHNGKITADPKVGGGLFALDPTTGKKIWHTPAPPCPTDRACSPAQSAAITAIPGVVFSGSVDGHLRAYSTEDGKILWDFDTVREYDGANGVKGKGGSMDGPGPVVVNGVVYVNSGYGSWGGIAGNVLLAFAVK